MGAYDRRSVLLGGIGAAGAVAVADGCSKPQEDRPPEPPKDDVPPGTEMSAGEIVPILVAVADVLMPKDELGPGVKDVGADTYFEKVLADPRMKNIKSVVTRGAVWINRAARKENNVTFFNLEFEKREALVIRLAEDKVRPSGFSPTAFVRLMLALTLEAFLGDPRHGGNKDMAGWKFIGGVNWAGRQPLPELVPLAPTEKKGKP